MYHGKRAFTLVELIVVITILGILGAIGFVSMQGYSMKSRDSVRVTSMKNATSGLSYWYVVSGTLPMPEGVVSTGSISGVELAYKGEFGDKTANIIRYSHPVPVDPLSGNKIAYGISFNKRYFQFGATLEGTTVANNVSDIFVETAYADSSAEALVDGNYQGTLIFSSGGTNYIANVPSLLWSNSGTVNMTPSNTDTRFVIDDGTNLPYSLNGAPLGNATPDQVIAELYNTGSATYMAVSLSGVTNSTQVSNTFTGAVLASFGGDIVSIESRILGTTDSTAQQTSTPPASPTIDGQVSLLLHANNGGSPSSFSDSSTINNTIVSSDAIQFVPKIGNASALFVAPSYLSVVNGGGFNFGTGDFTIDAWVYLTSPNSYQHLIGASENGSFMLAINGANIQAGRHNVAWDTSFSHGIPTRTWTHIALVRSGSTLSYYRNGTLVSSASNAANYNSSSTIFVGAQPGVNAVNGLIDEFRISKGVARWTANFTPSTTQYSPDSNDSLLLHFDGTNATVTDSSPLANTTTANGVNQIYPKFGTASALFMSPAYLTATNNSGSLDFGTGAFTIDTWVYLNSPTTYQHIIGTDTSGKFMLAVNGTNIQIGRHNVAWDTSFAHGISPGEWTHIAMVRNSGTISYYKNGVLIGSSANSIDYSASSAISIGAHPGVNAMNGLLDELRISKGVARWTTGFSVPTGEY